MQFLGKERMDNSQMLSKRNLRNLLPVLLLSFFSVSWVLSYRNGFVFDDYSLIVQARFSPLTSLFGIFPNSMYNDRPFRLIILKMLDYLFFNNPHQYYLVFVLVHLANVVLFYLVSKEINSAVFHDEEGLLFPTIATAFFGIIPTTKMTVSWISAPDLFCFFFMLLSMLCYFQVRKAQITSTYFGLLAIFFFFLSIRTKEMALPLPLILTTITLLESVNLKKKVRFDWTLLTLLGVMSIFLVLLLLSSKDGLIDQNNPYHQNYSPLVMFRNSLRYLSLMFDWNHSDFVFSGFSEISSWLGPGLMLVIFLVSTFFAIQKRNFVIIFLYASFLFSLLMVLPMENMQHRLYLYIPSAFFGFLIAGFIYLIPLKFSVSLRNKMFAIFVSICILYLFSPGFQIYKEKWYSFCEKDKIMIDQIEALKRPIPNTTYYIKGLPTHYNAFTYGPGNVLKMLFNEQVLSTQLVDQFPTQPNSPYVFIEYKDERLLEIAREESLSSILYITGVYPTKIIIQDSSENIAIGVTGSLHWEDLRILLNGNPVSFTKGAEFNSFIVPKELLIKGTSLILALESQAAGGTSNEVVIPIE